MVHAAAAASRSPLRPGGWEGRLWIAEDFDDPLPPELLKGFTGEE